MARVQLRDATPFLLVVAATCSLIGVLLAGVAPCDDAEAGGGIADAFGALLLASGALVASSILVRLRKPCGWSGWGRVLLRVLVSIVAAAAAIGVTGVVALYVAVARCGV